MSAQQQVDQFNEAVKVGDTVAVRQDGHEGRVTITTTRSEAQLMSGQPVVWLKGISGCYSIGHVRKVENPNRSRDIDFVTACVTPKPASRPRSGVIP